MLTQEEKKKFVKLKLDKYAAGFFGMVHNHIIQKLQAGLIKDNDYQDEYMKQLKNCLETEVLLDGLVKEISEETKPKVETTKTESTDTPKRSF